MPSADASQGNDATSARESAGSRRAGSGATQRMTEAPLLVPHGTFLTREKTEAEQQFMPCGMLGGKKAKKDTLVRRAYLQLDLLKPGDVFVSGRYSSLLSVGVLWRWSGWDGRW